MRLKFLYMKGATRQGLEPHWLSLWNSVQFPSNFQDKSLHPPQFL